MAFSDFFKSPAASQSQAGLARVHALLPPDMLQRFESYVAASEHRHTSEIRICIEADLPPRYLVHGISARERAVNLFGKLRVWDTEDNNGVLIYLLLSEHAIEIVADRGLNHCVTPREWEGVMQRLSGALREARHEQGLTQALEEVSALLVAHFPALPGVPRLNDLPNAPVILG